MNRLYKKEKLCGALAVDALFAPDAAARGVSSQLVYPLRMVWRENPGRRNDADIRFVITVPKRRLRHAVERVQARRRVREAFRLLRPTPPIGIDPASSRRLDVAFVWVANGPEPYSRVERAMKRLLAKLPPSDATIAPAPAPA